MRTTLALDDDVLTAAKAIAQQTNRTIGKVVSDLARRGLAPRRQSKTRSGFPVFDVAPDAPPITLEMVKQALDEE